MYEDLKLKLITSSKRSNLLVSDVIKAAMTCVAEPQPLDLYQTCSTWVHSGAAACPLSAWWTSGLCVVCWCKTFNYVH